MRINRRLVAKSTNYKIAETHQENIMRLCKANEAISNLGAALVKPFQEFTDTIITLGKQINKYFEEHPEILTQLELINAEQKKESAELFLKYPLRTLEAHNKRIWLPKNPAGYLFKTSFGEECFGISDSNSWYTVQIPKNAEKNTQFKLILKARLKTRRFYT